MAYVAQNAITQNLYDDISAILNPEGVRTFLYYENVGENIDYNGEAVVIVRIEMRESALQAGQQPAGFYWVDVELAIQSHDLDDPDRTILNAMEKTVRDSFERDMWPVYMDSFTTTTGYYTWQMGGSGQDREDSVNILNIQYTWLIRPSIEITTTTTT